MNLRLFKALKSLAVLLLLLEFLTPATLMDIFPSVQSDEAHLQILPASGQKNPVIFLSEETDLEEGQLENHDQKTTASILHPVLVAAFPWTDKLSRSVVPEVGKYFHTRPLLFTLLCFLLI